MVSEATATLGDPRGLHGRTARTIVSIVARHGVRCELGDGKGWADARSVLRLLMLDAPCGSSVIVRAHGARADEAVSALTAYLESGPFSSYTSIETGTNSDPAFREMTPAEKGAHVEMLNRLGAATITKQRSECRSDACDFVPPCPAHLTIHMKGVIDQPVLVTQDQYNRAVDAHLRSTPQDLGGFAESLRAASSRNLGHVAIEEEKQCVE